MELGEEDEAAILARALTGMSQELAELKIENIRLRNALEAVRWEWGPGRLRDYVRQTLDPKAKARA